LVGKLICELGCWVSSRVESSATLFDSALPALSVATV